MIQKERIIIMCISKLKNGDILTKKMEIVSYIGNFIFLIMISVIKRYSYNYTYDVVTQWW